MENQLQTQIIQALGTILVSLIGLLVAYAVKYINTATTKVKQETSQIQSDSQRKIVNDLIDRVNAITKTTVISVENTTKQEILQAISDNKIDKTELQTLSGTVLEQVKGQLTEDGKNLLSAEIGDLDTYIKNTIEKSLAEIKIQ